MIGMLTLFKWCKHQYFHVASGRVGGQHGGRLDCFCFFSFCIQPWGASRIRGQDEGVWDGIGWHGIG